MKIGTYEQMVKDMNNGIYDMTDNGTCIQCGNCCSNLLPVKESEIKAIRSYIKKHHIKEQKRFMPLASPILDLTCPFLNENKAKEKCTIYAVRPQICRSFSCNLAERSKGCENLFKSAEKYITIDVRETFFGK